MSAENPNTIFDRIIADVNVDANFRRILAGKQPTVTMSSENENSRIILQRIADSLCLTESQVKMLQTVYDLGVLDGRLAASDNALSILKKLEQPKADK